MNIGLRQFNFAWTLMPGMVLMVFACCLGKTLRAQPPENISTAVSEKYQINLDAFRQPKGVPGKKSSSANRPSAIKVSSSRPQIGSMDDITPLPRMTEQPQPAPAVPMIPTDPFSGDSYAPPLNYGHKIGLPQADQGAAGLSLPQTDSTGTPPAEIVTNATQIFWWERDLIQPVLRDSSPMTMSHDEALTKALSEAPELKILHSDWYIQSQQEVRQSAAFDWVTFVDAVWNRDNTPVGSQLDGAFRRLRSRTGSATAGVRRLDQSGGQLELSQQIGFRESNSQFINPNNQGNARLALRYERPLLRRGGEDYNTGALRISQLDKDIAFDRMQAGIQDHLLATSRAYWSLVLTRGDFIQKVTSWNRAKAIADEMETRLNIDVSPTAFDRAKSEVASRLTLCIQAEHDILTAQEVLLELIYASRYTDYVQFEVVTTTLPPHHTEMVLDSEVELAVQSRSEVHQAIREIKAATIELDLAQNEVLPQLNLVLSGYASELSPKYDVGKAFTEQFPFSEPGAGVGLEYELPYKNRAAIAAKEQRRIAVAKLQQEFENIVGQVKQDVRQQVIQSNKYASSLPRQKDSLVITVGLLDRVQTRRDLLADGARVGELYLSDLLQIQGRLQNAESQYLQAQASAAVAQSSVLRSRGALQANSAIRQEPIGEQSVLIPE